MGTTRQTIEAIVIGGSAGALVALSDILPALPAEFPIPVALVLHVPPDRPNLLVEVLGSRTPLRVKEAEDKEMLVGGTLYLAPPNYHLLIERRRCFSLSVDELVHFSRPAIDVLFESAADAYGPAVAGLLLTGANEDGAQGLSRIEEAGGLALVQSPDTALVRTMPDAALRLLKSHHLLPLDAIGPFLARLGDERSSGVGPG
jgi:two-component system, chemotaxis family, protein-glutamate methylesterase/glutaminase